MLSHHYINPTNPNRSSTSQYLTEKENEVNGLSSSYSREVKYPDTSAPV